MNFIEKLKQLEACEGALEWASQYNDIQTAWENCKRSDWMLWLLGKINYTDEKSLRLIAVECARRVQHLMKDEMSVNALDVAERYAYGNSTDNELSAAWDAARAYAWDAVLEASMASAAASSDAAAAASAASAAADAAADADAYASMASAAASSAAASSSAAAYAAADAYAAGMAARDAQSDIIRKYIPKIEL